MTDWQAKYERQLEITRARLDDLNVLSGGICRFENALFACICRMLREGYSEREVSNRFKDILDVDEERLLFMVDNAADRVSMERRGER